jgi:hypothetical protein
MMMGPIEMGALVGTNPLGFLAALGVLYCAEMQTPAGASTPRLSWTDEVEPRAVLWGVDGEQALLDRLESERDAVAGCTALNWPSGKPLPTAKPDPRTLREWARACFDDPDSRSAAVFNALVAEGAYSGKGEAKPTHLDFTAGQQKLLVMVGQLAEAADRDRLGEALKGWIPTSAYPSLAFDSADERLYALRAVDPSGDKKSSAPGANWLAFLGLMSLPVVNSSGVLRTTACARPWKRSSLEWMLPTRPLTRPVLEALLRGGAAFAPGVRVVSAAIRRTEQGGYGSFSGVIIGPRDSREVGSNPLIRVP